MYKFSILIVNLKFKLDFESPNGPMSIINYCVLIAPASGMNIICPVKLNYDAYGKG